MINYRENKYLTQYRELKLLFRGFVGEKLLCPTETFDRMETYYPLKIKDLRFQIDHVATKQKKNF